MIGINVCLAAFLAVLAIAIAEDVYPNLFNDVDADEILANTELRQQYYNCVMETSPCMTEEQKFFKGRMLPGYFFSYLYISCKNL